MTCVGLARAKDVASGRLFLDSFVVRITSFGLMMCCRLMLANDSRLARRLNAMVCRLFVVSGIWLNLMSCCMGRRMSVVMLSRHSRMIAALVWLLAPVIVMCVAIMLLAGILVVSNLSLDIVKAAHVSLRLNGHSGAGLMADMRRVCLSGLFRQAAARRGAWGIRMGRCLDGPIVFASMCVSVGLFL